MSRSLKFKLHTSSNFDVENDIPSMSNLQFYMHAASD